MDVEALNPNICVSTGAWAQQFSLHLLLLLLLHLLLLPPHVTCSFLTMQSLFRGANHKKQADFLMRDFSQDKSKDAACKNAYTLLGQHRHKLAAAFFVLGASLMLSSPVCVLQKSHQQLHCRDTEVLKAAMYFTACLACPHSVIHCSEHVINFCVVLKVSRLLMLGDDEVL